MRTNYELAIKDGKFITPVNRITLEQELRRDLYQAQNEEERKQIYDQAVLCNHLYLMNLCCDLTIGKIGFMNDDIVDDLYQEGMLYISEALAFKRKNPNFKWCKPSLLMYGIGRYLNRKLEEMIG